MLRQWYQLHEVVLGKLTCCHFCLSRRVVEFAATMAAVAIVAAIVAAAIVARSLHGAGGVSWKRSSGPERSVDCGVLMCRKACPFQNRNINEL